MRRSLSIHGVWLALALLGCQRLGCGSAPVAELLETHGKVERDLAAQQQRWTPASVGDGFEKGDGLRTGATASALLRVGERGRARVEADTTIRFFGADARAGDAK